MVSAGEGAQGSPARQLKESRGTADAEILKSGPEPQRPPDPPAHAGRGSQSLGGEGGCAIDRHKPGMDAGQGSPPCLELVELAPLFPCLPRAHRPHVP